MGISNCRSVFTMRQDVKEVIRNHINEILISDDEVADWFHYLDDVTVNVHDYNEDGVVDVDLYAFNEETGTIWDRPIQSYWFTRKELQSI